MRRYNIAKEPERSEDGEYKIYCEVCGKPLTGRRKIYCSEACHIEARSAKALKAYHYYKEQEKEHRSEALEEAQRRVQRIKIRESMCTTCVWRRDDYCTMPSCFRLKGIGYDATEGDIIYAEVGEDAGNSPSAAAETPGVPPAAV